MTTESLPRSIAPAPTAAAVAPPAAPVTGARDWCFARRAAGSGDELSAILSLASAGDTIAFSGGFPAPETFPTQALDELARQAITEHPAAALQYTATEGMASLRATLRDWIAAGQGVLPLEPQLMVTSGGIEGLSLIARCLLDPGDTVLVEAPTYLGAITAFTGFEARVEALPADEDGLDPDALRARLERGPRARLLYVIPDFQNPTGRWTTTPRRERIVEVCRRYGLLVVEDVAYRELAFVPEDRPSLWALGPDVVLQLGTFSKIFVPGVRLGWATGPAELVAAMVRVKQNSDQCAGGLGQWLADRYLRSGQLEQQLRKARALYRERATALLDALGRHLPDGCTWTRPAGGFFTWVNAPVTVDTAGMMRRAAELGVAYVPGAPFYPDRGTRHQLRLSFSRVSLEQIDEGARRLGVLLSEATHGETTRSTKERR